MIPERSARENTMPEKSEAEQIDELQKKLNAAMRKIEKLENDLATAKTRYEKAEKTLDELRKNFPKRFKK